MEKQLKSKKKHWEILCTDGEWEKIRANPEADQLRKLTYGIGGKFYLGTWKDGEEAIYRIK